ncbi:MAG TPA: toxin-antitoxin system subunit antitoxin [Nitrospiraceae bacterium]|nr:toxin-antitoxin system subunit antitoxin [Nitrospiraceae bacterium]
MVTKNGRPAAIPLNVDEYACLKETLDVLGDPAQMKQLLRCQAFDRSGKKELTFEDIFGEPFTPIKKHRAAPVATSTLHEGQARPYWTSPAS